ncbi:MAG: LapA family protein, partial [Thermostichales cyanobacterium SZTDM-1c_bins_54]
MRQLNFVIVFAVCVMVALFAMQNATPVEIYFTPGMVVKAPLVLELLIAAGIGAVLAWFYTVWTQAQSAVELGKK